MRKTLADIYQHTHARFVLLGAAIADQQLKHAILTKMRKPSRKLESSLSAKIARAYALGLIDNITRSRLEVARKIRNEFAHAGDMITFQHPEIRRLLDRFPPDCDTGAKNEFLYMWHLGQVESHLVSVAGPDILKSSGASATKD